MEPKERKKRGPKPKHITEKKLQRSVTATDEEWEVIVNKAIRENLDTSAYIVKQLAWGN